MRLFLVVAGVLALGGCNSGRDRAAVASAQQGVDACKAQTFKTNVDRVRCLNDAVALATPAAGASSDLLAVALAQRLVLAEKLDRRQITQAEFDLEMARTMSGLISEEQRRNNAAATVQAARRAAEPPPFRVQAFPAPRQPTTCTTREALGNLETTCN